MERADEIRANVEAVRARRGGHLLNLDRMLLHSPELTRGWNSYLGAVRTRLSVSPRLREIAICTVAVLNQAEYEFMKDEMSRRKKLESFSKGKADFDTPFITPGPSAQAPQVPR